MKELPGADWVERSDSAEVGQSDSAEVGQSAERDERAEDRLVVSSVGQWEDLQASLVSQD